ncbi:hypothetical protein BH10PSE10_BH10PSE10_20640 [soil metagenome]
MSDISQQFCTGSTGQANTQTGLSMTDDSGKMGHKAKSDREERLKSALRDNLKRRKSQARGRAGMAIVTPEDDAKARGDAPDEAAGPSHRKG